MTSETPVNGDHLGEEVKVEALRNVLGAEESLPLGMRSRMEARIAREGRTAAERSLSSGAMVTIAVTALTFGVLIDPAQFSPVGILAGLLGTAAYAGGLSILLRITR